MWKMCILCSLMNQLKTIAVDVNPCQILQRQGHEHLFNFGHHMFDTPCNVFEGLRKLNRGLDTKDEKLFLLQHHAFMARSSKIAHDHQFIQASL